MYLRTRQKRLAELRDVEDWVDRRLVWKLQLVSHVVDALYHGEWPKVLE